VNSQQVNEIIREYFRTDVWSEHSALGGRYTGHITLIDWGRRFIENEVLPELQRKNNEYLATDKKSTCFFWIHRNSPQVIHEALRLLAYTGIVNEHSTGIKATRSEIGTRYAVNLGCLFALETAAAATAFSIAKYLDPRRMSEYGMNHPSYTELIERAPVIQDINMKEVLKARLANSIEQLDLTPWMKSKLRDMELLTIGEVIMSSEDQLQETRLIGEKRARTIQNAALSAVYEYLSG
jgi:hypothetical protein